MDLHTKRQAYEGFADQLPDGYRERYLANLDEDCIHCGFVWKDTPEGMSFWFAVHRWAINSEYYPLPPLPVTEKPTHMNDKFVFVYYRTNEIKVLTLAESKRQHSELISEGWKHTATLDVCQWMEHLFKSEEIEVS